MKKRYKRTFLVLYAFCSLLAEGVSAQSLVLSLEKTISLAADSSLEAFRTKNLFLSGYWEFRNYKAERLNHFLESQGLDSAIHFFLRSAKLS